MQLNSSDSCEIGFDIETVKDMDMIDKLPEPKVKLGSLEKPIAADLTKTGTTKDPVKLAAKKQQIIEKARIKEEERLIAIEEKIKEAKDEQISGMALNPFYGRICSYAVYGNEGRISKYSVLTEINDKQETNLIKDIFREFANTNTTSPTIITWNGEKFDLRFLYTRAVILGIELPSGCVSFRTMTKRYENENHIDLMTVLHNYGAYGSLENAAYAILGEKKLDHDFSKFIELIETGQGDEIGRYNLKDAELTYRLYKRVQPLFLGV